MELGANEMCNQVETAICCGSFKESQFSEEKPNARSSSASLRGGHRRRSCGCTESVTSWLGAMIKKVRLRVAPGCQIGLTLFRHLSYRACAALR